MAQWGTKQRMYSPQEPYTWPVRRVMFTAGLTAVVVILLVLWIPLWAAVLLTAVALILFLTALFRRSALAVCFGAAVLFSLVAGCQRWLYVTPIMEQAGQQDVITARVTAVPAEGRMYAVRVVDSRCLPEGCGVLLYVSEEQAPQWGDYVIASITYFPLTERQEYRRGQGVHLRAFPTDFAVATIVQGGNGSSFHDGFVRARTGLSECVRHELPAEQGDLLAAMCFGDKQRVSQRWQTAFSRSGIAHLLAVSGLHLSVVSGAILLLFARLGRRISAMLTMSAVLLFMWLIGDTPSVIRAGVMVLVLLTGRVLRQRADSLNSLGLAAVLLLSYNPYMLFSVGFQLSFAATVGVLTLSPRLAGEVTEPREGWQRITRAIRNSVAVCVGATLPTLPLVCYYFGGFPLTTVLTNLAVVPVSGALLLLGWSGALFCLVPFLSWLGQGLLVMAGGLVRYMQQMAVWMSAERLFVHTDMRWLLVFIAALCLLVMCGAWLRVSWRRVLCVTLSIAVTVLGIGLPLTAPLMRITVAPTSSGSVLTIRQGRHTALCITSGDSLSEAVWLTGNAVPQVVLVRDVPIAQVSALEELVQEASVYRVAAEEPVLGVSFSVTDTEEGKTVPLWGDSGITLVTEGWWRLDNRRAPLWICVDATAPPPKEVDGCVLYAAGVPRVPLALPCIAVGNPRDEQDVERVSLWIEDSVTFTVRKSGEWSVLPWL